MKKKTRACILEQFNKPLKVIEIDIPDLQEGQMLVRMTSAGICGSDVHMYQGRDPRTRLPMILGHEGTGIIEEINGKRKTIFGQELRPGDKITWNRGVLCGHCYYCAVMRKPSLCENRWAYGIHKSMNDPPHLNGCYAEHIILSEDTDILLLDDRDPSVYVSASCSGATAAHAFEYANVKVGDTVLVQGPGPLGIFLVAFSKEAGAKEIIIIGGTQERLDICSRFGATHLINRNRYSKEQIKEAIYSITNGRGVDVAFEASGDISAVEDGIPLVKTGGKYISAGFGEPSGNVNFPWFEGVIRKNLQIQGVWVSDTSHLLRALTLIQKNFDKFSYMVTHRFDLDHANSALETVASRKAVKAVLT